MKINGTATGMFTDSGAQSTVLGEQQFHLVRSGLKANLISGERNLRVYGSGCLPVVSKFQATIECHVTQGEGWCFFLVAQLLKGYKE